MPRIASTPVTATPSGYPSAGVIVTPVAADVSSKQKVVSSGKDLILAFNSDVSPHTVTINSVADDKGRTGDITAESIAAGVYKIFGPFSKSYWAQSDGNIYFEASDATVKFAVIQLP
jgi:hypothetical protein